MDLLEQCKAELAGIELTLRQLEREADPRAQVIRERLLAVWVKLQGLVAMLEQEGD